MGVLFLFRFLPQKIIIFAITAEGSSFFILSNCSCSRIENLANFLENENELGCSRLT